LVPISIDFSATRAERLADLTELNVATANTSVPPAVASDEIVTQSAIGDQILSEKTPSPHAGGLGLGKL
jgi:hypothetical protein